MIKKSIQKVINRFGYTLSKTNQKKEFDLDLYEKLFPKESLINKCFYNIGAGNFYHPYWTNIDLKSSWYSHAQKSQFINFDLQSLERLPIESKSAEIVYSSHTVEHITDEASQNLFNEVYRILKKEGIFRFSTPDINLAYRAYQTNDRHYFYWIDQYSTLEAIQRIKLKKPMKDVSITQIFLSHFASQFSELHNSNTLKITDKKLANLFQHYNYSAVLNYFSRNCDLKIQYANLGNHINWWNESKAGRMLKEAGFEKVYHSGYGQSFSPILRNINLFDTTHPKISLFMEVRK